MLTHAMLSHVRRHPFAYLSLMLHAAACAVFFNLGSLRIAAAERIRQQQSIDAGTRLTAQARLEKRVYDMARIKSLLEQGDGTRPARADDDVQFSAQPRAAGELLEQATVLAQQIEAIERAAKARELARVLDIPLKKAMEQVAPPRKADALPDIQAGRPRNAAAKIEQLEAQARGALEQRRHELAQRRDGTQVRPGAAPGDPNGRPGPTGPQGPQGATGPQGPSGINGLFSGDNNRGYAAPGNGTECTLGQVTLFAGSVGVGVPANGAVLSISQNPALFSLLGIQFGGDGYRTFALPDLRSAAPAYTTYFICDVGVYPSRR